MCEMHVKGNHMLNNQISMGAKNLEQMFNFRGCLKTGNVDKKIDIIQHLGK